MLGKGLRGRENVKPGTYHSWEHGGKGLLDSPAQAHDVDDRAQAQQSILEEKEGQ